MKRYVIGGKHARRSYYQRAVGLTVTEADVTEGTPTTFHVNTAKGPYYIVREDLIPIEDNNASNSHLLSADWYV